MPAAPADRLAAFHKRAGFSREATWEVVRACPHSKSPRDPRGFARHVWCARVGPSQRIL